MASTAKYMYICRKGHIVRSDLPASYVSCGPCNKKYPKNANEMKLVTSKEAPHDSKD